MNNKLPLLALLTLVPSLPALANDCETARHEALVQSFHADASLSDDELLFRQVCGSNGPVAEQESLPFPTLGFADAHSSTLGEACATGNRDWFRQHQQELAQYLAPTPALKAACNTGLQVLARVLPGSTQVEVVASAPSSRQQQIRLHDFSWEPLDALRCDDKLRGPRLLVFSGTLLTPEGVTTLCQRRQDVPLTLHVQTEDGSRQTLYLRSGPQVGYREYRWGYLNDNFNRRYFQCRNDFNELVGGFHGCEEFGFCDDTRGIAAWCAGQYGRGYYTLNHARLRETRP